MSLQKNFPRERKYYFWAIFLCHLIAQEPTSSEMDRKLFGTLAYRMISKAAADIPSNQVCDYPDRTPQERRDEDRKLYLNVDN